MRIHDHPILGKLENPEWVVFYYDGSPIRAIAGEPIAAALMEAGVFVCRYSTKERQPRGVFCGIGQCCDCMMVVDGVPNVRTCRAPAKDGMCVETQFGTGRFAPDGTGTAITRT